MSDCQDDYPQPTQVVLRDECDWERATAWCEVRFGSAHRFRDASVRLEQHKTKSWVETNVFFSFRHPLHALEFKLRWG